MFKVTGIIRRFKRFLFTKFVNTIVISWQNVRERKRRCVYLKRKEKKVKNMLFVCFIFFFFLALLLLKCILECFVASNRLAYNIRTLLNFYEAFQMIRTLVYDGKIYGISHRRLLFVFSPLFSHSF